MKKLKIILAIGTIGIAMLTLNSCKKDSEKNVEEFDPTAYTNYLQAASMFALQDVEEITMEDDNLKSTNLLSCLNITIIKNENGQYWPLNKVLDYGVENCEDFLGNNRRGIINISISDWWRSEGSVRKITFDNYYFNNTKLEGIKTITNTGLNAAGNLTFTKLIDDASITYADSSSVRWNCARNSELIEGGNTFIFADDVWSVTGSGTGINVSGQAFTVTITSALIYKYGCYFPVSGIVEIVTDGGNTEIINYGNGECDTQATLTVGDITTIIDL